MTASYGADNALIVLNMRGQFGKLNLINMNMQKGCDQAGTLNTGEALGLENCKILSITRDFWRGAAAGSGGQHKFAAKLSIQQINIIQGPWPSALAGYLHHCTAGQVART